MYTNTHQKVTSQKRIYFLNRLINGGYLTPSGGMLSAFFPKYLFRRNARLISKLYRNSKTESNSAELAITIPPYSGKHPQLIEMMSALAEIRNEIRLAVVHGSIATGEEIEYSDFDGLIIIADEAMMDADRLSETAYRLHQMRKIMHRLDPFQHHGWFVLAESELKNYPEWFLPTAVLHHSKSLIGENKVIVKVQESPDVSFKKSFYRICESLIKKLSGSKADWNLYQLKSIFSEFMMLPSAYVQARDEQGIFKKFSFESMREDFTPDEFHVMDEVTSIRSNWKVELSDKQIKFFERIDFMSWKKRQRIDVSVPIFIESLLHNGIFSRMSDFTKLAKSKMEGLEAR